jgi:hypothetical protein
MKTLFSMRIEKPYSFFPDNPAVFSSSEETRGFPSSSYGEFGFFKDFI